MVTLDDEQYQILQKEASLANILTARAGLLDFYSDRAVSFASLFLASIVGLVTVLTLVQVIGQSILEPSLAIIIALCASILVYSIFAYVSYYTFTSFTNYADIADKLATDLENYAEGKELKITIAIDKHAGKAWELLQETLEEFGLEKQQETKKEQKIHFSAYASYMDKMRKQRFLKQYAKYFKPAFAALIFLLALLGYYPFLRALIQFFVGQ